MFSCTAQYALSLVSIRVVETVPGKSCMAFELPNPKRQMVRLSEIVGSKVYQDAHSPLTVVLGKDIGGQPVVADGIVLVQTIEGELAAFALQ